MKCINCKHWIKKKSKHGRPQGRCGLDRASGPVTVPGLVSIPHYCPKARKEETDKSTGED